MDTIVSLCRRRGFVFPSSEIYGGLGSAYDYAHYGVLMKGNVKAAWLRAMVQERDDVVALDSALMLHPRVWEASGHVGGFSDPMVDCRVCKHRFRADDLENASCPQKPSKHPGRGPELRSHRGARLQPHVRDDDRPGQGERDERLPAARDGAGHLHQLQERAADRAAATAVRHRAGRQVVPQRDHAGQLPLPHARVRADGDGVLRAARRRPTSGSATGSSERADWYLRYGIEPDNIRVRAHDASELSHYSSGTSDLEYLYPIGWAELEGIANRGDYDLKQHTEFSGVEARGRRARRRALRAARDRARRRRRPRVPGLPVRRLRRGGGRRARARRCCACIPRSRPSRRRSCRCSATTPRRASAPPRSPPSCAPHFQVELDTSGAIGRRYRRQDEIGTPWAITIDHESLEDDAVTVRDRDSLEQVRVPIGGVRQLLVERLNDATARR